MATIWGYNPPFIGGTQNVLSRQEDDRLIKNDILQFIMTTPGERVMRPDYGSPVKGLIFEHVTNGDLQNIADDIQTGLEANDPRIVVSTVSITKDEEKHGLNIVILATMRNNPQLQINFQKFLAAPTS